MAKKNVFPVCSPNVLEFSPENSIGAKTPGYDFSQHIFPTDGSWGELLLGEANNEDWGVEGSSPGAGWFYVGATLQNDFFGKTFGITSIPPAGLVVCIGSKDKQEGTYDNVYTFSRTQMLPNTRILFDGDSDFGNIFNDQQTRDEYNAKPRWKTLMFNGSSWVFLGSNSWY